VAGRPRRPPSTTRNPRRGTSSYQDADAWEGRAVSRRAADLKSGTGPVWPRAYTPPHDRPEGPSREPGPLPPRQPAQGRGGGHRPQPGPGRAAAERPDPPGATAGRAAADQEGTGAADRQTLRGAQEGGGAGAGAAPARTGRTQGAAGGAQGA